MNSVDVFCNQLRVQEGNWIAAYVIKDVPDGDILAIELRFDGARFERALHYGALNDKLCGFSLLVSNESQRTVSYEHSAKAIMHGRLRLEINSYIERYCDETLIRLIKTGIGILQEVVDDEIDYPLS